MAKGQHTQIMLAKRKLLLKDVFLLHFIHEFVYGCRRARNNCYN